MTTLLTADIHQTTAPRDAYRFDLFHWLAEQSAKYNVDQVLILGDLTEKFDRHPSHLVNRIALGMSEIAEVCPVYVLRGNHDAVDGKWPFFAFLSGMPNVVFITDRERIDLRIRNEMAQCCFLPSSHDPQSDWANLAFETDHFIFMHQTVIGAAYDNGMPTDKGLPLSFFAGFDGEIFSGDIHSPQTIGKSPSVTYVGAPYRVDFGDIYTPRCLLLGPEGNRDLRFPCPVKHALDITDGGEIKLRGTVKIAPGDHVRARVRLAREQLPDWPKIRSEILAMAKRDGWGALLGPSLELLPSDVPSAAAPSQFIREKPQPEMVLNRFAERHEITEEVTGVGAAILGEALQS